jgi:hypothetical protein
MEAATNLCLEWGFDSGQIAASPLCAIQPGVSGHSRAYVPISREIVAQLEVCKGLILLDNPRFGIPYFEPGNRRFESVRTRI